MRSPAAKADSGKLLRMRSVACAITTRGLDPVGGESREVSSTVAVTITGAWASFSNGQVKVGHARESGAAQKHRQTPVTSKQPRAVICPSYGGKLNPYFSSADRGSAPRRSRSEERRVGKEC